MIGTTDLEAPIVDHPKATDKDVDFLLDQTRKYLAIGIPKEEIQAVWCGLRPLVSNPKAADTAKVSRDHVVHVSSGNLITIAGGKWTTYRKMAKDTINEAVKVGELKAQSRSRTERWKLAGGDHYNLGGTLTLVEEYNLPEDVANYLHRAYGDRAGRVADLALKGFGNRLVPDHPFIEAEVLYATEHESARTVADFLARRIRLSFLDQRAAKAAAPRVMQLMSQTLDWSEKELARQRDLLPSAISP